MADRDDLDLISEPTLLGPPAQSRSQRRHERVERQERRRRRGRRGVVLLVALVLVAGAAFGAYTVLRPIASQLSASNDYSGPGQGQVQVIIASGASGRAIGQLLQSKGVVKTVSAFVDAAASNPKSAAIQPGAYTLRKQMSGAAAVTLLLDPASRSVARVTVREGLRVVEVVALLVKAGGRPQTEYTDALKDPAALGLPAQAKGNAEGWLFPDTYEFGPDVTPAEQLKTMVTRTRDVLGQLKVSDAQAQRVLTIASIAEVEASSRADFAKVARVIDNRLRNKLTGGKLQLDSTVSYALGKRILTTTPADRNVNSRYNTYRYPGLPAGPISNPGRAAIEGALRPTPGPWLFFVTVNPGTGETKFAVTAAEHATYVKQFQAWCNANPGKC